MPTKNKCSCKVKINNHSNKTRCCKGNVYGNFGGKNFCFVHAEKNFSDKAIYIQKIQRGRRCRQLLENIYKKGFERAIKYNDPSFSFDWPNKPKIISKKDNAIKLI